MISSASRVALTSIRPGDPVKIANPQAPVDSLVYSGVTDHAKYVKSIDNVYLWIAARFRAVGDKIGFHAISAWKIAALVAFGLCLMALASDLWTRLAIALTFSLVFGDLGVLLYANTLYLEFSVVLSSFFAMFATALLLSGRHKDKKSVAFALLMILWLGATKQQYMPLAVLLGLLCTAALLIRGARRRYAPAFFVASLGIPVIYGAVNSSANPGLLRAANFTNNTDTWLGPVLPAAPDKAAALARVGLPQSCELGIGENWLGRVCRPIILARPSKPLAAYACSEYSCIHHGHFSSRCIAPSN